MHCVIPLRSARNLLIESRQVAKTKWPLVESITTSPSQWQQYMIWLAPDGCPERFLICRDKLLKTTFVATASTATSNVSSSCAYRTMCSPGFWLSWLNVGKFRLFSLDSRTHLPVRPRCRQRAHYSRKLHWRLKADRGFCLFLRRYPVHNSFWYNLPAGDRLIFMPSNIYQLVSFIIVSNESYIHFPNLQ